MLTAIPLISLALWALCFTILIQPGELLMPYAQYINCYSNFKAPIKKLLTCPYCLFTWALAIIYGTLFALSKTSLTELLMQIFIYVPLFFVFTYLAVVRLKRYINGN